MGVLFVTSFTPEMFRATGRRLVNSFLRTETDGELLVCSEGFDSASDFQHPRLRSCDLNSTPLLQTWLEDNRDVIPERFGGAAGACACSHPADPFSRHRARCHNAWFNYNAARWFRKVVSLDRAVRSAKDEYIVWLDSDCVIKSRIPEAEVSRWFGEHSVFYLKSRSRLVLESGVLGVRNSPEGRAFVDAAVERYRSRKFRRDGRWDDGYQFQRVLRQHPEIPSIDLATGAIGRWPYGHVVPLSPVGPFIYHQKGSHPKMLGLLK